MRIDLPWPPSSLRPNAVNRQHWRANRSAGTSYKGDCLILCRSQGLGKLDADGLHLSIRFCPPDRRRRDLDGMLSSIKHGLDAISETVGVDDYHFGFTLTRGEPVKGGAVQVTITEMEAF